MIDLHIHTSHRHELRKLSWWLALMGAVLLALMLVDIPASLRGYAGYPPLHTGMEILAVCVACLVFAAGWTVGGGQRIVGMVVLACAFAGVALLDVSHALSYAGMPDYVTPAGPEKAINFWLAARSVAALALLLCVCLPWRASPRADLRYLALAAVLALTALLHWVFLFHAAWVPRTFVEGQGLTDFKRAFEYLLVGLNVLAAAILWLRMRKPQEFAAVPLFAALVTMAMSEYFFTLYAHVTDVFNIAGHIYKVIAYGFLYRAIFVATVRRPYAALHKAQEELTAILNHMADGVVTTDAEGTVISINQAACAMFGYQADDILGGRVAQLVPEPSADTVGVHPWRRTVQTPQAPQEAQGRRRDGSVFPIHLTITGTTLREQPLCIALVRDLTQQRQDEQEIRRLAFFDALTGLANRRLMRDHLQHAHLACKRTGQYGALMFLDLDHFQHINDNLGLAVGDELLQCVTQRLRAMVREDDTLARIDGDGFAVVLENLGPHHWEAVDRVTTLATRILEAVAKQPYEIGAKAVYVSVSIGMVLIAQDDKPHDDLLKEADTALHQAKLSGRNTFCFFDPATQAAALARAQLEQEMREGLGRQEFALHYQLQVNQQHQCIGVEALLRWTHPQRGRVSPAEFIPLAEETGFIVPLGQWVLETACAQMVAWSQHPVLRDCTMGVNVSAAQFAQADFQTHVLQTLEKSGANPAQLKLELTESILVSDVGAVTNKMRALQSRGIQFSLDDFGTGYSSLAYLKRLPLAQLKIDQSFVRDLLTDPNDATIAHTVVALGHSLGLHVIAEGVETEAQRDALLGMGCDAFQGFLYGRPEAPGLLAHRVLSPPMLLDSR